jgi:hypothetical protein
MASPIMVIPLFPGHLAREILPGDGEHICKFAITYEARQDTSAALRCVLMGIPSSAGANLEGLSRHGLLRAKHGHIQHFNESVATISSHANRAYQLDT